MIDHPRDLRAWQRWADHGHPLRRVRGAVSRSPSVELVYGGPEPDLVVVVDAWHTSVRAAVVAPLAHLEPTRTLLVGPPGVHVVAPWTPARTRTIRRDDLRVDLVGARAMLGSGHYVEPGGSVHAVAAQRGVPFLVVQHGLLTPKAPPLPPGAHLLAWSEADAEFWASGRDDVTWTVTGSQLLADAAGSRQARPPSAPREARTPSADERPVYLGQLHGAELPFRDLRAAAEAFFAERPDATYRPHPSERDRRSRRAHARWRRMGIEIETDGPPLRELDRPVVSVFSTGVLEAAAAGLPAYVHHPDPPAWLRDLWDRYDMGEFGGSPTPAPTAYAEPARAVAAAFVEAAG